MKTKQDQQQLLATAFAGLILATAPLHGAIVTSGVWINASTQGYDVYSDEMAFAGDVSNSDLLHGIIGTGPVWNDTGWGDTAAGLNDGGPGGDYDFFEYNYPGNGLWALGQSAWAVDHDNERYPSYREFVLPPTSYGLGWDITEIQSIASWSSGGFHNQNYTVSVSYVGSDTWETLTTVTYLPSVEGGGATMVTVTDPTGVLTDLVRASGVDAIRFGALDLGANGAYGGNTLFREIDAWGVETVPEASAAALLGLGGLALFRRRRAS